ncbi:MAG: hypothetical protein GEV09_26595 [Pseudonocardiaceae bacterium]|nr:hypothetical protein [Pseudonocardiaceae bacterium]
MVEITDQLTLAQWPAGARVLVRREPLHPGAQQTFDDIDGYRFTALLTDQPDGDIVVLEQRHRARPRGGPHPRRQGHRGAQPALRHLRPQRRVAAAGTGRPSS